MEILWLSTALAFAVAAFAGAVFLWRKAETRAATNERNSEQFRADAETAKTDAVKAGARADAAEKTADNLRAETETQRAEIKQNISEISGLKERLQTAETNAAEKIKTLLDMRESMGAEFKNLAQNALENNSAKFKQESGDVLKPLQTELKQFRERVDAIHTKDAEDRSALKQQITDLQNNAAEYGKSADNLARALKGESKTQGGWGEVMLANLLEKSGLREGEEYETQKTVRGEDGEILRPDVVVNLPDGKHLIIDSKISLRDFCAAAEAKTPEEEKASLARHATAVKNHVAELSGRHYARAKGVNAPDFVFMFMEIEPAFFAALKESPNLFSDAYDKKIILCAPTTLMATLRTVERIWQLERQNRNAEEIARQAGNLYDKFVSFVQNMDDMEKGLNKARESYGAARKQMETGSGNLIGRANKLRDLGANAKKDRLPETEALPEEPAAPDKK